MKLIPLPHTYIPPYPIKHTDKSFVEGEIEEWLLWYQIEHVPHSSHSPYNTPLLVAYTYASDGSIKKRRFTGMYWRDGPCDRAIPLKPLGPLLGFGPLSFILEDFPLEISFTFDKACYKA